MFNLRGHHLICLHFFQGEGYDESFIRNLREILSKVEKEGVIVAEGVDDVCKSCPYLKKDKCEYEGAEEEIKKQDEIALKLLNIKKGDVISWKEIQTKLPEIFPQWYEKCCSDCDWLKVCQHNHYFQSLTETHLPLDKKILSIF